MRLATPLAIAFALLLAACASSGRDAYTPIPARTAWIIAADGHRLGQATFTEAPQGVLIRIEITERGLAPGWHGLHLHERGDCSDFGRGFEAAGGHLGMGPRTQHGLMNPAGPEAGDLPNLFSPPAGPYAAEFFSSWVSLRPVEGRASLLDGDGSALMIHASPDDQVSQPIGNAGARVACAALTNLP
jgi:superoxide dismutase, Cu-Zn family